MEITNEMVEQLLKKHYKSARISECKVSKDGTVQLLMELKPKNLYARVAQRILNTYPEIKMVFFTGEFIETAYTRGSLKVAGFKINEKPKPQPKPAEPDYEKVFSCGETELCRGDLESLPCPFDTKDVSDETMQEIANELESEMTEWREWNKQGDVSDDRLDEVWWEKLEHIVVEHKIPYYEDEEEN